MSEARPNIVLIVGEDVGRHLGCYGDDYAITPNLDRLAADGTLYTNGFTHAPVCAPSRSGLVIGQYPCTIGSHHMRSTLVNPPRMFTHELRDAGYHVSWPTKLDFNFQPLEGWCDTTAEWIGNLPEARPFFAYVNFSNTHESQCWHNEDEHAKACDRLSSDQFHNPDEAPVPAYLPDTPNTRREIACYYDNLTQQDHYVGDVLRTIDEAGVADNTIVIYMTDHGRGLPREKRWCYGAGVHLPLIIRAPGLTEPGSVIDDLVGWVDIAPTILSLTSTPIPSAYQGQVFLGPDAAEPRSYCYGGRDRMDECFDRTRFVRSQQYHYIRNFYPQLPWAVRLRYMEQEATFQDMRELHAEGELQPPQDVFMQATKPAEELYDAQNDPDMVNNLAGQPAHEQTLADMRAACEQFIEWTGDLGQVSERTLIERGIVTNRVEEDYRPRCGSLPERHRIGPASTILEMEDVPEG
jgi:N-sulfoglucosamine sulfohydrolase